VWALQFCPPCPPYACGLGTVDCCANITTPTAGCKDFECCVLICDMDSFCCEAQWDGLCVFLANQYCPVCGGTPPG
jgi:hypothetical protein